MLRIYKIAHDSKIYGPGNRDVVWFKGCSLHCKNCINPELWSTKGAELFSVDETVGGQDYMEMESDGYFILTPGYSLTAQKRIYPTAWFQMRPYASIGVEYDVFGAPDNVKYKFAPAHKFTKYDIDIDPLWANIGGGIEFLSANGLQIGLDYRYQYNNAIQLHNIKLSGSYRF